MKTKSIMNYAANSLLSVMLSLTVVNSTRASTPIPREFWISTNATANFYSSGAGGTIDNPLDGSTQVNFDSNMNSLPAESTIHILAGLYPTKGYWGGFGVKSGQKIIGSGIDVTILQHPAGFIVGGSGAVMISSGSSVTNVEISDLTCDCNIVNTNDTYSGIGLHGTQIAVRRVKVINCAKYGGSSEAWGIVIGNNYIPNSVGNIIEECEISQFNGGGAFSAISFNGGGTNNTITGSILNNRILTTFYCLGINGSWTRDVLVDGNYINGSGVGFYSDTGDSKNVILTHNHFVNVGSGMVFFNAARANLTFAFNYISITNEPMNGSVVFYLGGGASSSFTNVLIMGNTVSSLGGSSYFLNVANTSGLLVFNNSVDSSLINYFANDYAVHIDNNYDLYGNYSSMNTPAVGGTTVTSFGKNLISSASAGPALVTLGLPSNPAAVVTNNSASSVLLSGGLTVTNGLITDTLTITNSAMNNGVVFSVTPTNVMAAVKGAIVANFQTNAVFNAPNGISTTISNTANPTSLYSGSGPFAWTNNQSITVVGYVSGIFAMISYNGTSMLTGSGTIMSSTLLLQPGAIISVSPAGANNYKVFYHPL